MMLQTIQEGAVGWAATMNSNISFLRLGTSYIQGLQLIYSSSSQITVAPGQCRDSADLNDMSLTAYANVSTASSGVNGLDTLTGTGTVTISSGGSAVTGSGTSFFTNFGSRTVLGTYSSSTTAVTGSSTHFLSQVAVGDLFGDTTHGFSLVTAIASDTALTLSAALPNGNASAGTTGSVIENPTIQFSSGTAETLRVKTISSNTALTTNTNAANTHTASAFVIGATLNLTSGFFLFAFLASGMSGTQPILSTQRTTLLNPGSGYLTSARRIGSAAYLGNAIIKFVQNAEGNLREYFTYPTTNTPYILLNAGSATSATVLSAQGCLPPTARTLKASLLLAAPTAAVDFYVGTNITYSSNYLYTFITCASGTAATAGAPVEIICDGAQQFAYYLSASSGSPAYIFAYGYSEVV